MKKKSHIRINVSSLLKPAFILLALVVPIALSSQKWSLNKDTFLIGEKIILTIEQVDKAQDEQSIALDFSKIKNLLYEKDTLTFEPFADVQIDTISDASVKQAKNVVIISSIKKNVKIEFTIFSIGIFVLKNGLDSLFIKVMPPPGLDLQKADEIKDIKPIIEDNSIDFLSVFYYILAGLLLLAILYWIYKRFINKKKAKNEGMRDVLMPYISPEDEALQALQNLIDTRQYESADVKDFQTVLTDVLRQYTSRIHDIKSFELTSYEIIDQLKIKHTSSTNIMKLTEIFSLSDQVKFAKARPDHELCREAIDKAIYFVKNANQ